MRNGRLAFYLNVTAIAPANKKIGQIAVTTTIPKATSSEK
jgi:hypothetical protein